MSTPRLAGLSAEPDQALPQMPPEHEAHLRRLNEWVCARVDRKYRRGQAEHGGRLWEAPGLLAELQAETIDQLAYGQALEEHVARIFQDYDAGRATADDALARMRRCCGDGHQMQKRTGKDGKNYPAQRTPVAGLRRVS